MFMLNLTGVRMASIELGVFKLAANDMQTYLIAVQTVAIRLQQPAVLCRAAPLGYTAEATKM